MQENMSSGFLNIKCAIQPAHLRSLISVLVVCFLESSIMISKLGTSQTSIFCLVSVAEQTGIGQTWSKTPEDGFYVTTRPKWHMDISDDQS